MIAIRDINADHLPILEALMQASFEPQYGEAWSTQDLASTLSLPAVRARMAFVEEAPSGFCLSYHLPDAAEILMVAVAPPARRQGLASLLLADAAKTARQAGLGALFLEVREENQAARALYATFGFAMTGRRAAYYKGRDGVLRDAVTLRLPL